ncbi:hypothetical protein CDAR_36621 [Caerostris darwini]|uniref:Uncharacterized protein n=1 Tax=Caerostris darwini TaxID=1538125 RepID=A0AAV4UUZ8_9ARAC|nr:hypothetical protein CDAR_36621 [Caerostris darwini]
MRCVSKSQSNHASPNEIEIEVGERGLGGREKERVLRFQSFGGNMQMRWNNAIKGRISSKGELAVPQNVNYRLSSLACRLVHQEESLGEASPAFNRKGVGVSVEVRYLPFFPWRTSTGKIAVSYNNPTRPNLEVVQLSPESFLCGFSRAIFSFSGITRHPMIAC